jgi:hypothetical protein
MRVLGVLSRSGFSSLELSFPGWRQDHDKWLCWRFVFTAICSLLLEGQGYV